MQLEDSSKQSGEDPFGQAESSSPQAEGNCDSAYVEENNGKIPTLKNSVFFLQLITS